MAIEWKNINPDFSNSSNTRNGALSPFSQVGTIFDKMADQIAANEERAATEAYRQRQLAQEDARLAFTKEKEANNLAQQAWENEYKEKQYEANRKDADRNYYLNQQRLNMAQQGARDATRKQEQAASLYNLGVSLSGQDFNNKIIIDAINNGLISNDDLLYIKDAAANGSLAQGEAINRVMLPLYNQAGISYTYPYSKSLAQAIGLEEADSAAELKNQRQVNQKMQENATLIKNDLGGYVKNTLKKPEAVANAVSKHASQLASLNLSDENLITAVGKLSNLYSTYDPNAKSWLTRKLNDFTGRPAAEINEDALMALFDELEQGISTGMYNSSSSFNATVEKKFTDSVEKLRKQRTFTGEDDQLDNIRKEATKNAYSQFGLDTDTMTPNKIFKNKDNIYDLLSLIPKDVRKYKLGLPSNIMETKKLTGEQLKAIIDLEDPKILDKIKEFMQLADYYSKFEKIASHH